VPRHERAQMHLCSANVLAASGAQPDPIAAHLLLADPQGAASTVERLRTAAAAAARRGTPASAAANLERALLEPPDAITRVAVLAELGRAELLVRSPHASEHLRQARDHEAEAAARARLSWELADALLFAGDWDEAVAELRRGLSEAPEHDQDLKLRLESRIVGLESVDARRLEGRSSPAARAAMVRGLANQHGDGARPLRLTLAMVLATSGYPPAHLRPLLLEGLDGGKFLSAEGSDAVEAVQAALVLVLLDDLDGAISFTDAMLDDAARRGSLVGFLAGSTFRAFANLRRGALIEAEADAAPALELGREQGLYFVLPFTASYLGLTMLERGRSLEARELLRQIELPGPMAATSAGITLMDALGCVQRVRGELEPAIESLRACGRACEGIGVLNPSIAPWRSELALALRPVDLDAARELAAAELALSRAAETVRGLGISLRTSAAVSAPSERQVLLEESIAVLEGSPLRLELARSLLDLGAHLRREGQRARSREPLRRALEIAHACAAEPLADRARQELLAAGARPRRPWLSGLESLTPSELRIARLAAQGRSNNEVAQTLFITTRTVKGHLSSVYRKLDISSRRELPRLLADGSGAPRPEGG
jgi:DNA-binding CsgD family transcriptional regulator